MRPTILIDTSTMAGAFTEEIVAGMAAHTDRPIILPMSNPTSLAEAAPADLIAWTGGRALVATGSPFPPLTHDRTTHVIAQANNALIFPGLGLGVIVSRARTITDGMFAAAAQAVATAVATAAVNDGVARVDHRDVTQAVQDAMWQPVYPRITPGRP